MSLEDNIKELTLAVNRLITALDVTTASVTPAPSETVYEVELEVPAPKKAKPELKAVPTKEVEVKEAPAEPAVEHTHETLKALCLDLVRKDPANRDKIKKIISSFDESTLVSDVADTNLPSLARQLLALAS
jgi:hypothetical protein